MKKTIFIDDVIHPNMGSAISIRPIIDSYIQRYKQFIEKDIKIYCIKTKEDYIFHAVVPSEKNANYEKAIFYDVIIQFYPVDKLNKSDLTVKNYGVKVFSNAPSWMFDFTYIFAKTDNIPSFIPKKYYSKAALTEPPKKTNPIGLYGIDRIVFCALYHLEINTAFRKNRIDFIVIDKMSPDSIVKKIMSQEEKLAQIDIESKKARIKKAGEKANKKNNKNDSKLNIINKKEKELDSLLDNKLKANFGSSLKKEKENNLKSESFKSGLISVNGMKKRPKK